MCGFDSCYPCLPFKSLISWPESKQSRPRKLKLSKKKKKFTLPTRGSTLLHFPKNYLNRLLVVGERGSSLPLFRFKKKKTTSTFFYLPTPTPLGLIPKGSFLDGLPTGIKALKATPLSKLSPKLPASTYPFFTSHSFQKLSLSQTLTSPRLKRHRLPSTISRISHETFFFLDKFNSLNSFNLRFRWSLRRSYRSFVLHYLNLPHRSQNFLIRIDRYQERFTDFLVTANLDRWISQAVPSRKIFPYLVTSDYDYPSVQSFRSLTTYLKTSSTFCWGRRWGLFFKQAYRISPFGALRVHRLESSSEVWTAVSSTPTRSDNVISHTAFKGNLLYLEYLIHNPLLIKYSFDQTVLAAHQTTPLPLLLTKGLSYRNSAFSSSRSNLVPLPSFSYFLQRRVLRVFTYSKLRPNLVMWYAVTLLFFIQSCTGKGVYLKYNPFVENSLSFVDLTRCELWGLRAKGFQRILGPKIFIQESIRILYLSLKYKDSTFLINWLKAMLYRMSFWKYRLIFRYLKYLLRALFFVYFEDLEFKGLKFKLKGKISAAGTARTRTLFYRIGKTSHSNFQNRVNYTFTTVDTFTGVLGFHLWLFF